MTLQTLLEKNIKKLTTPLKSEEDLIAILKRKLTKNEYKVLMMLVEEIPQEQQLAKLSLDAKRYEEIKTKLFKKINFQNLKDELLEAKKV